MRSIRVGSRESRLAVIQSELLIERLRQVYPDYTFELVLMKTTGDKILDKPLDKIGGKGLFIKELDKALLEKQIDLAVHSLKDMPMQISPGLTVQVYSAREDPRDALVLPLGRSRPDTTKPLGSSSQRRRLQLRRLYSDWTVADIRGNVLTRLEKLDRGEYGGLVLAAAGLKRLGLAQRIYRFFDPAEMIPAPGQGTLVIVTRDTEDFSFIDILDDPESRYCSRAERSFVKTLDGGCSAPIAAYGVIKEEILTLTGLYCPEERADFVTSSVDGSKEEAETLGKQLALNLLGTYHRKIGKSGKVWLVGAGPGDPGLLTIKADKALQQAEVVFFDRLVGKGILSRIPSEAECVYVGKYAGHHEIPQEAINRLLTVKAAQGKRVVRLKGGDPFVFGRGGEELEWLKAADIPFETVPGVSSALGVPAYAGIPVSHRDYGSQIHIITGHLRDRDEAKHDVDYEALVKAGGTFIFLMGVAALGAICEGLLKAGLNPDTPGAVIEQGTTAKQRSLSAPLSCLTEEAKTVCIKAPAVIIIGRVCALSSTLSWIESKPLSGLRIGVTQPRHRNSRLQDMLSAEGAEVVTIPTIQITPIAETPELEQILGALTGRDWFVFTSPTGVEVFFDKLKSYGRDLRIFGGVKFGVLGKATADILEDRGIRADLIPKRFSGADLGRELQKAVRFGERVILPRARSSGGEVTAPLLEAGIDIVDIPIYDKAPLNRYQDPAYRELLLEGLDWIAFTSPSTVEGFAAAFGANRMREYKALCIGELTAQAAARYGMETHVGKNATLESMTSILHTSKKVLDLFSLFD
ncbi:MAG: hydroxymethylbilane synthase [Treponema sp.]|jgi:uroporphyrinogen III methyltransferase/synthase|nr:hydroxymethylbilane synthase [Treponema sp.]